MLGGESDDESMPSHIMQMPVARVEAPVLPNQPYQGNLEGLDYTPQPYLAPEFESKHLDIANLVQEDKKLRERANFFVCPICACVVFEPVECGGCSSVFCAECIIPWQQKNNSCPKKCKGNDEVEWRQMHRLVNEDLKSLEFKCENAGCCKVNKYEEAMLHKKTCEAVMQPCPQKCGLGLLGKDMEFHI